MTSSALGSPTLCRLKLRLELRALREASGLTAVSVARTVKWSTAKMTRMETGDGWVQPTDVEALCRLYGASPEETELLSSYALVTKTNRDQWHSKEFKQVILPGFSAYLGLEEAAVQIRTYESEYVPGLLQTEAYMRELLRHTRRPQEDVDRLVKIRLNRQTILARSDAPKLGVVVNESVLRRVMGGADLMREQLLHLVTRAQAPNVRLQVVRFSSGYHPAMTGPFTILTFGDPKVHPIVHVESLRSARVVDDPQGVGDYEDAWTDLQGTASSLDESASLITQVAKEL